VRRLEKLNIRDVKHLGWILASYPEELDAICQGIDQTPQRYYREFPLPCKGKPRPGAVPQGRLRVVQESLNAYLQRIGLPEWLQGGIRGRSNLTNAKVHAGKPALLKSDIERFFPSVKSGIVYAMFHRLQGCSPDVARILTRLTTFKGALPQGSPTSMMVANLVLLPLAHRLGRLAKQHDAEYRQFVDDVAISGPRHIVRLVDLVARIMRQAGFRISQKKTECFDASAGERVVTGIRVNQQMDAPSKKIDRVRRVIGRLEQETARGCGPKPTLVSSLEGQIRDIASFNKGAGRHLRRRLKQVVQSTSYPAAACESSHPVAV